MDSQTATCSLMEKTAIAYGRYPPADKISNREPSPALILPYLPHKMTASDIKSPILHRRHGSTARKTQNSASKSNKKKDHRNDQSYRTISPMPIEDHPLNQGWRSQVQRLPKNVTAKISSLDKRLRKSRDIQSPIQSPLDKAKVTPKRKLVSARYPSQLN